MVIGVISYTMTFLNHSFYQIRRCLQKMSDHEERGRGIMLFESFQNGFGVAVFITAVKSKIDHFFIVASHIIRIIPCKIFCRGIACGLGA